MVDARHRHLSRLLTQQLRASPSSIEALLSLHSSTLEDFFSPQGQTSRLLFYNQASQAAAQPAQLTLSTNTVERPVGRLVYFYRLSEKDGVRPTSAAADLGFGVLGPNCLEHLQVALSELHMPLISRAAHGWSDEVVASEAAADFFGSLDALSATVGEAVTTLRAGFVFRKPDKALEVDSKAAAFSKAAGEPETVAAFEAVVDEWCDQTEALIEEKDTERMEPDDAGPEAELEYWRNRYAKLSGIAEQMKGRDYRVTLSVLNAARSRVFKRWKALDVPIAEAANEAKDTHRALSTLDKWLEPLLSGAPVAAVSESLPGLLNAIKVVHTTSRTYNTSERLTGLFRRITNALVGACRRHVHDGEPAASLWGLDAAAVAARCRECIELCEAYVEQYQLTRDKLKRQPKGRQFDFPETVIFDKAMRLRARLETLAELFTTVHQFRALFAHGVPGLSPLAAVFAAAVEHFASRPYGLLDCGPSPFGDDVGRFESSVCELERELLGYIGTAFEGVASTDASLLLLRQLESVLNRPMLKDELDSKLAVVFNNYELDLETVRRLYEKQKDSPPIARNTPPVAGAVMWARQLMRAIEEPMLQFQANVALMAHREAKKIVRTYNRIARTIVEFETLWHVAWTKSVELSKAGVAATLLVRHPTDGKLYVNFDREVLQLIREARLLSRIGVAVPEGARSVLLQEAKFKHYFNELSYSLDRYRAVVDRIPPVLAPLLEPHVRDFDRKLQPGMVTLTWTSMNIDGYLHRLHATLFRLDELVGHAATLVLERIERGLRAIANMRLVSLPDDASFTLDEFVALQERVIEERSALLATRSVEIEGAVADLMRLVGDYPLEPGVQPPSAEQCERVRSHYARLLYRAVLNCTKASLGALKKRAGSRASGGFLFTERPFFDVDVELAIPHVTMTPTLDEIQEAVNRCARAILGASKRLPVWEGPAGPPVGVSSGRRTLFEALARDKEIVRTVLVLTGAVEGVKRKVLEYLARFRRFEWLWRDGKDTGFAAFMARGPSVDDFEAELQRYAAVEAEVHEIVPVHNIGIISLETAPVKYSLRAEAAAWKSQYTRNLQVKAKRGLDELVAWMDAMAVRLKREVGDLEGVRYMMGVLDELRDRERVIEQDFAPVQVMYGMLARHDHRVSREEAEAVADLTVTWKRLLKQAEAVTETLAVQQKRLKSELVRRVKQFAADTSHFRNEWESSGPAMPGVAPAEGRERLARFTVLWNEMEMRRVQFRAGEELFGLPKVEYFELSRTKKEIDVLEHLYALYHEVTCALDRFRATLWTRLPDALEEMVATIDGFEGRLKRVPKSVRSYEAFTSMKKAVEEFVATLPILRLLLHPGMRSRHWTMLMNATGKHFNMAPSSFRLANIMAADLLSKQEDVHEITTAAQSELQLEARFTLILEEWTDCVFVFSDFKDRGPILLEQRTTGAMMERLDEAQMAIINMLNSRHIGPFREEVQSIWSKLAAASDILELWIGVQALWLHLEVVFSGEGLAKQMPQEALHFQAIDRGWMSLMAKARDARRVLQFCHANENLRNVLAHMQEQLETSSRTLADYLDLKRAAFPRFFLVSDRVLLDVLSHEADVEHMQTHAASLLDAVHRLDLEGDARIEGVRCACGEPTRLLAVVNATGGAEEWLGRLLVELERTVRRGAHAAILDAESMMLEPFANKYGAQLAVLGMQVVWARELEDALRSPTLNECKKKNAARVREMIDLHRHDASHLAEPWARRKLEGMITLAVHQRDVVSDLVAGGVRSAADFRWQLQPRCYWDARREVARISIVDAHFDYSNGYLGVWERLCITPLTTRCYVTLTQALGMHMSGATFGPGATGKTETVKELGRLLGKHVVLLNCSSQMTCQSMGSIFKGLAQSGCWGFFDEFDKLETGVLAAAAQQMGRVFSALRENMSTIIFTDGKTVGVGQGCGVFVSLQPGSPGRTPLPEDLRTLLRGIAMVLPDCELLIAVKLTASGFVEAAELAKKLDGFYVVCKQHFSRQPQYDFGLRAVLAALRILGQLKRAKPEAAEADLVLRTLRDHNLPKLAAADVPAFLAFVEDLFPEQTVPKATDTAFQNALDAVLPELGLQAHEPWVSKVVQLFEAYLARHTLVAVGPSGAGKSAMLAALHAALGRCESSDKSPPAFGRGQLEVRLNPKSMPVTQLFGHVDPSDGTWRDGAFCPIWRKANSNARQFTWIVLDGPMDPTWVENLTSVMDDSMMLTLANNERLPMLRPNVTLLFEVEDLRNASPTTVSRAGVVHVGATDLGWLPVVEAWLATRKKAESEPLLAYFKHLTRMLLDYVGKDVAPLMVLPEAAAIASNIALLTTLLDDFGQVRSVIEPEVLERLFLYSSLWSIGGCLESDARQRLDNYLRKQTKNMPFAQAPDTVYEFRVDEASGDWIHWGSRVPFWEPPSGFSVLDSFTTLLIPTIDSVRNEFLASINLGKQRALLVVGAPSTGKTSSMMQALATQDASATLTKRIQFGPATTAFAFQRRVESLVEKRMGKTFGPIHGKRMVVFIDDLAMADCNVWGDNEPLELLRVLIERRGMYSLDRPGEWKSLIDLSFVAAMLTPGAFRNDLPNRSKRHFHVVSATQLSGTSVAGIFGAIMKAHFNTDSGAPPDVLSCAERLTEMTVQLWELLKQKLLPTPAKFHYVLSLRDLGRVFLGLFLCPIAEVLESEAVLISLWAHECERVFADRLVEHADRQLFNKTLHKMLEEHFGKTRADRVQKQPAFFADFMREPEEDPDTGEVFEAERVYEPIPDLEALRDCVQYKMQSFNEAHGAHAVELILFNDALHHLMHIARIISAPRGAALLVGVAGSGKQSLARLAAALTGSEWVQPVMTSTYGMDDLLRDLRPLYETAGVASKSAALILSDKEIKSSGILDVIAAFLDTGEVERLLDKDALAAMANPLTKKFAEEHPERETAPSSIELFDYFVCRARDNLHMVLCFSPTGDAFRQRCQRYTALLNYCTIDWFLPWPEEALTDVAKFHLDDFALQDEDAERILKALITHMTKTHTTMCVAAEEYLKVAGRHVYMTPKTFESFILNFVQMYTAKAAEVDAYGTDINTALFKLDQVKVEVENMKGELRDRESSFTVATERSVRQLHDLTSAQARAEKKKADVSSILAKLGGERMEIEKVELSISNDLAAAQPALEAAAEALSTVSPKDIIMLKNMKNPPEVMKRVFDAAILLFMTPLDSPVASIGQPGLILEPAYGQALPLMSRPSFLDELQEFPKDQINDETIELLYPYTGLVMPCGAGRSTVPLSAESLAPELVREVSGNVAGLVVWVHSMVIYASIARTVKPRMATVGAAEIRLAAAQKKLDKAQAALDVVLEEIREMRIGFENTLQEKQLIMADIEASQLKIDAASALIDGVADHHARWKEISDKLADQIRRLSGDVAVACAFVCYTGPFDVEFRGAVARERLLKDCAARQIPHSADFSIRSFLGDEIKLREWTLGGLPDDEMSMQNVILATRAQRWPFFVDPQGQGQNWVKISEAANGLRVTSFHDQFFREKLEDAMAFGQPLLLQNVDGDLDPIVAPVLAKKTQKSGRGFKIALAHKECEYSDCFRLYLACNLSNPHLPAKVFGDLTVINFTITTEGLEQWLLHRAMLTDWPEAEERFAELRGEQNADNARLKTLEDELINGLALSEGTVLESPAIVELLKTTKESADVLKQRLAVATAEVTQMQAVRDEYAPVARLGALLYFLVVDMADINHMYTMSLQQFVELYAHAIERADRSQITSRRINYVINNLRYLVTCRVHRGLFRQHRSIWTLMLALRIQSREGLISGPAMDVLFKAGSSLDIHSEKPKPFSWIADQTWLNILMLSRKVKVFAELVEAINRNDILWKHWFEDDAPEELRPPDFADKVTTFETMLLVRCIREDRTMLCMSKYVMETLGKRFVESRPLGLAIVESEAALETPILTLLSPGSDPTPLILDLARQRNVEVLPLSMGQADDAVIRRLLHTAAAAGKWVLLQNCHLDLKRLRTVEEALMEQARFAPRFRLWLTSEPNASFPLSILHRAVKITNEAPSGLRASLRAAFTRLGQDVLDAVNHPAYKPLLFALAFMHSVLQQRRNFGPLGFCSPYDFSTSDLDASVQFIQNHLTEANMYQTPVDWNAMRYVICEVHYGGHVAEPFDRRIVDAYGEIWLQPCLLEPGFEFYEGYAMPKGVAEIKAYLHHIDELPLKDRPEVFGMHSTADLAFYMANTKSTIRMVQSVGSHSFDGPAQSKEDVVLHEVEQMKEKLPNGFRPIDVKAAIKNSAVEVGGSKPLNIFVQQETDKIQMVLRKVRSTLERLKPAIAGSVVMTSELADAFEAVHESRVPTAWVAVSELQSTSLAVWFANIVRRVDHLANWLKTGRPPTYWLTGLFNPHGFLTANLQEICRKNVRSGWTLDQVVNKTLVINQDPIDVRRGPDDGVYLYGLHLNGASWDRNAMLMADSAPKVLFDPLPVLHVTGVLKSRKGLDLAYTYVCPVYKTRERDTTDYIFDAHLPTQDSPKKWLLRGVALIGEKD